MSNQPKKTSSSEPGLTYFEKQRDLLISEIAISMDSVLNNINALNRSLEGVIQVGKEFDSVSQLWSNFYDSIAQAEQIRSQQQRQSGNNESQVNTPKSRN